jgi:protein-tyrosine-phosphatase
VGFEEFTDVQVGLASAVDQLAAEFEGVFEREYIARIVNESAEQLGGSAVASFVPVLAQRFARERLLAQARAEGKVARGVTEVVFVSLTGGGRAQIGAALLDRSTGGSVSVHSAGSGATGGIDPNVHAAMLEIGIDLTDEFNRPISQEVLEGADIVVTMGRSVGAIEIPETVLHVDWRVGDPAGADLDEVRRVREDIERRVEQLAEELTRTLEVAHAYDPTAPR